MVTVHEELELKYDLPAQAQAPSLLAALHAGREAADALPGGGVDTLSEGDGGEHHLQAVYFDTRDLALAAARVTLRRRSGGEDEGWHLKLPGAGGARQENRVPLGRAVRTVPAPLRRLVEELTGGRPLVPVAQVDTLRRVRHLLDPTGRVLLELADDRVEARRLLPLEGAGEAALPPLSWREVEVEVVEGDPALLHAVDAGLLRSGLQRSASASKLARVLDPPAAPDDPQPEARSEARPDPQPERSAPEAPAAEAPPARARPVVDDAAVASAAAQVRRLGLTATSSAGEVVLAHLAEQVEQVLHQQPRVRADAPDGVHKMRVATRRLRSALTTFQPLFADSTRPLRTELKWLAAELGAARDAEVLRERLVEAVTALDEDGADSGADGGGDALSTGGSDTATVVSRQLDAAYRDAHDTVLAELTSERYERLLDSLQALLQEPGFTPRAGRKAAKVLPRRVARTYDDLEGLVQRAQAADPGPHRDELLHEARKAAKQVRYAAESIASVFGRDATRFARAVTALQEVLGEHQDSVVTRQRLRRLATGEDVTPAVAFAYGRLYAREEAHAAAGEQDVSDAWNALRAKRLHRWLR